ncbi:HlyD family efflux transporter periplasmic adaptor subunit [Papillibacter cinnamivorans]|uniref:Biotin-lipoyl like n=1 Tax=Papillibacter cinnamivorans DSM 12816 TaxID=1122930 RepID=A0A1W2AGI0_9FIRM|nr:HlyD family efflux transporter periplasmic adaptor subunit [Papillibacter cinnamivorans]SMC59819.1 Biotin-lipoyl like [Papillibacter cinnamivorans DSM 12816]
MSENIGQIAEQPAADAGQKSVPVPAKPGNGVKKPGQKKKKTKRIIAIVIAAVIVAAVVFGFYKLFFSKEKKDILTEVVYRGSIQSTVEGSGVTTPKDSEAIVLGGSGEVQEVYVTEGQYVTAGTPLYKIDSADAETEVADAQKALSSLQKELSTLQESYNNLTVRAPFAGKLLETGDFSAEDSVNAGTKVALLVDDSKMLLKQYYSYAYKDSISAGQTAQISIPSSMAVVTGTVQEIEMVRRVSSEGSLLFEVTFAMDNPGTLTEGMEAAATLTGKNGESIYPYEPGSLTYNRKSEILAKSAGTVLKVNLHDYAGVAAGEVLLALDSDVYDTQMSDLQKRIESAEETLAEKTKTLNAFQAVAPIDGTVLSCALVPGETAASGTTAVTIADTRTMTVAAQIDELSVNTVKVGMDVMITQQGMDSTMTFIGQVSSVSLEGKYENGVSYFPAVITVDNPDGALMSGMYVSYSMVTSSKDDCLLVSSQAIKYTESGTCLFIKADSRPDNAVDLGENVEIPDGFYAVPVETGLSDDTNVEIVSGVEEGTEVFTQFMVDQGSSYMGY